MTVPTFHFQYMGKDGWEAIGAGIGEEAEGSALDELRELSGGTLAAGRYQYIDSRDSGATWQAFELGADGKVLG